MLDPTAQNSSKDQPPPAENNPTAIANPATDFSRRQFLATSSVALIPQSTLFSGVNLAAATLPAATTATAAALINPQQIFQRAVFTSFFLMPGDQLPEALSRESIGDGAPSTLQWFVSEVIRTARRTDDHAEAISTLAKRITDDSLPKLSGEIVPSLFQLAAGFHERCLDPAWQTSEEGIRAFGHMGLFRDHKASRGEAVPALSPEQLWQEARKLWVSKKVLSNFVGSLREQDWFPLMMSEQLKPSAIFLAQNLPRHGLVAREALSQTIASPALRLQVNALVDTITDPNTQITLRNLNERFSAEQHIESRRIRDEARAQRGTSKDPEVIAREERKAQLLRHQQHLESRFDGISGDAEEFYDSRLAIEAFRAR